MWLLLKPTVAFWPLMHEREFLPRVCVEYCIVINDQANFGASLLVVIHLAFRIQSTTKKVTGPSYRACVARARQMSGVVMSQTSLPQIKSPSFSTCGAEPDVDSKWRRSVPVAVRQPTRQRRSRSRRRVRARNVFVSVPPTRSGTVHPSTTATPVPEPLPMPPPPLALSSPP